MKLKKIAFLFFCTSLLFGHSIQAQKENDSLNYYLVIAKRSRNADELISAYKYFNEIKEHSLIQKNYRWVVFSLMKISTIQGKLGQLYDSETSAVDGIKYLDNLSKDSLTISYEIFLLNRLGIIKRKHQNYEESLKRYFNFFEIAQTKEDSIIAYNNIGVAYSYLKKYSQAKNILEKAYFISSQAKDEERISLTLSNLGYALVMLGEERGILYMKRAIDIRIKTNDSKIYETYKNITEYYKYKKDTLNALVFAKKGYTIAKQNNNIPYLDDALSNLIDLKSYKYLYEFKSLRDSIRSVRLLVDNKYSETRYNYTKAELGKEKEKSERITYQFLGGFVLLSSVFLFFILKSRHKKDTLKTRFDTERQISKKLHDEVANSVFHTMSKQQNKSTIDIELIDDLEEIYLKTRDISKTSAALKITENFDEDLKDLVLSYKTDTVNIFTRNMSEMPWNTLSDLKKETVYRVLQELMINMTKHSNASMVTLQFQKEKRKIAIHYTDNGVGAALKKSNGLQNMENRIKDIGGTVTFESETNKGFQVKMTV